MENHISMQSFVVMDWYFFGLTRQEIAERRGISTGTVSNILKDFNRQMDEGEIKALREFAVAARKANKTVLNMLSGSRVEGLLARAGISADEQKIKFVDLFASALAQHCGPEDLAKALTSMVEIQKKTQLPIAQVPETLESKLKTLAEVERRIAFSESRLKEVEARERQGLEEEKLTKDDLKDYKQVSEGLLRLGASPRDLKRMRALLVNCQENGFSATEVVARLTDEEPLKKQEEALRNKVNGLQSQAIALGTQIDEKHYKLAAAERALKLANERTEHWAELQRQLEESVNAYIERIIALQNEIATMHLSLHKLVATNEAFGAKTIEEIVKKEDELREVVKKLNKALDVMGDLAPLAKDYSGLDTDEIEFDKAHLALLKHKSEKLRLRGVEDPLTKRYIVQLEETISGLMLGRALDAAEEKFRTVTERRSTFSS